MSSWRRSQRAAVPSNRSTDLKSRFSFLVLVKRALNMSSCSRQSRVLLAAMRSQLAIALEQRQLITAPSPPTSASCPSSYSSRVSCNNCGGFMVQPVCMPCGHSICKSCVDKSTMLSGENLVCPKCNHSCPKLLGKGGPAAEPRTSGTELELKVGYCRTPTLTLQNAFRKWYPEWVESCRCREEGNQYANQGEFALATQWYTQALQTGVCDFRVLGNRSRSFLAETRLEQAHEDAELACRLHPFWAKGHYRRGAVLERQGLWQEAIAAYLLCLHYGGNDQSVLKAACQLLDKNMSAAQKASLSEVIKNGTKGDPSLSPSSLSPSSSPSPLPTCDPAVQDSLGNVVGVAVSVLGDCMGVEAATKEALRALVLPAPPEVVDAADFECVLCTCLLYNPVTTPCGHSFCQSCLCRSFDHSPLCPVCRLVLVENFQQHCENLGKMRVDEALEGVLQYYFQAAYSERRAQERSGIEQSLVVGTSEMETLPIFVCTMAYPALACPLHIFEPRYRLMIRRCMESGSRRFGMCQPAAAQEGSCSTVSFTNYGTILYVSSVESMEDGRFLISTKGERRFKVHGRGMTDGYHTATITFLFDERVTHQEDIASLRTLQQETYDHAKKWLDRMPLFSRMMMMQLMTTPLPSIDPVPECCPNGPEWVWWFVHSLPTTPTRKLDFLKCTLLRERLMMLKELLPLPELA